jgi:hypothetical protein
MIVIRRMVDRRRAYTAIFLKGEPPKIFPTSDAEHARILQVYKQDRPHEGILNDFAEIDFPAPVSAKAPVPSSSAATRPATAPWPLAPRGKKSAAPSDKQPRPTPRPRPAATARSKPRAPAAPRLWLVTTTPAK